MSTRRGRGGGSKDSDFRILNINYRFNTLVMLSKYGKGQTGEGESRGGAEER